MCDNIYTVEFDHIRKTFQWYILKPHNLYKYQNICVPYSLEWREYILSHLLLDNLDSLCWSNFMVHFWLMTCIIFTKKLVPA